MCEFTFYRLFWLEKIKENKLIDFNKNSIKKNILYIYQEYLKDQRWIYMGNYIEKIYNFKLRELSIFEKNFEKLIKLL